MIKYSLVIKSYREDNFLTQEEFAKLIGVSAMSVIRWESGKVVPTIKTRKKIYNLLNSNNNK